MLFSRVFIAKHVLIANYQQLKHLFKGLVSISVWILKGVDSHEKAAFYVDFFHYRVLFVLKKYAQLYAQLYAQHYFVG